MKIAADSIIQTGSGNVHVELANKHIKVNTIRNYLMHYSHERDTTNTR